jgi:predicted nuclease of restriction endonuclease-like (RecB) superfamily
MRKFYLSFPILDALRQESSWTHYRLLSRLDTVEKRNYYLNESIENSWNYRVYPIESLHNLCSDSDLFIEWQLHKLVQDITPAP